METTRQLKETSPVHTGLWKVQITIRLTWSKLMALLVLIASFYLDAINSTSQVFMFALPFIVFLITGKQFIDYRKEKQ